MAFIKLFPPEGRDAPFGFQGSPQPMADLDSLGVVTRQVPAACEQPDEAARGRHPDALANDEI